MSQRKTSGYGWRRSLPDRRDWKFTRRVGVDQTPDDVDNLALLPDPALNQLARGSCTGHGIAETYYAALAKEGKPLFLPSRLFIYYNERDIEGTVPYDSGAEIRDGMKSVASLGVCPETDWPYDIDRFAEKPPDQCYADARAHTAIQYEAVDQQPEMIESAMAEGLVVVFGFVVYESFEEGTVAQDGIAKLPTAGERIIGGHCVVAYGYNRPGQVVRCRNSWGPEWGNHGNFTLPYSYMMSPNLASDLWVMRLVS